MARSSASLFIGNDASAGWDNVFITALLLSIAADREIARSHGRIGGSGSARIGFWTGLAGSLFGLFAFFLVLTLLGVAVSLPTLE